MSRAIEGRRPELVVVPGPPAGGEGFRAAIEQDANRWVLVVDGAEVPRTLRRELPAPGADCEELSGTVALMVARFLEDLPSAGGSVVLAPIDRSPPPPSPPLQLVDELSLGANPGVTSIRPVLTVGVGGRRGAYQLELDGDLELPETSALDATHSLAFVQGRVELEAERRWALGPGALRTGALVALRFTRVAAQGPFLFHSAPSLVSAPQVGLRGGYDVPFGDAWAIGAWATVRIATQTNAFAVDGYAAQVTTRPIDGDLAFAVSRTFF